MWPIITGAGLGALIAKAFFDEDDEEQDEQVQNKKSL